MRKSQFTEQQIVQILAEFDAGASAEELGRRHGVHDSHLYFLRQIGYEVINSPGIARLRGQPMMQIEERGEVFDSRSVLEKAIAERLSLLTAAQKESYAALARLLLGSQLDFLAHALGSSEGSSSHPLGNYEVGKSRGELSDYYNWTKHLESLDLVVPVQGMTPSATPANVLYSVTPRGRDVAAAAFDRGLLRLT